MLTWTFLGLSVNLYKSKRIMITFHLANMLTRTRHVKWIHQRYDLVSLEVHAHAHARERALTSDNQTHGKSVSQHENK